MPAWAPGAQARAAAAGTATRRRSPSRGRSVFGRRWPAAGRGRDGVCGWAAQGQTSSPGSWRTATKRRIQGTERWQPNAGSESNEMMRRMHLQSSSARFSVGEDTAQGADRGPSLGQPSATAEHELATGATGMASPIIALLDKSDVGVGHINRGGAGRAAGRGLLGCAQPERITPHSDGGRPSEVRPRSSSCNGPAIRDCGRWSRCWSGVARWPGGAGRGPIPSAAAPSHITMSVEALSAAP
ncbi:hypothetical protein DFJ74DRAFT_652743 [Hyaloraphidium curvatum]|nr:hypothetical protein DFJ74DRAFT_652743 [Hyaloraphidium curvatum]